MSQIINESTSVVQVDSSRLQNGDTNIVYVSTTTIPGQLVTVIDATGYLSSPQSLLLSTVGNSTFFADGSFSTILNQRFSYVTLVSQDEQTWATVNASHFPDPTDTPTYRVLDAVSLVAPTLQGLGIVSSATVASGVLIIPSTFCSAGPTLISSLYVNALSSFVGVSSADPRMTVIGPERIYGSTVTIGAGSFRGSISTLGDCFNTGNISSKVGTIYVSGNVTTSGTIRGQRGNQVIANTMDIFTSASFVGPVSFASSVTVGDFIRARSITANMANGVSMNVMSSITFTPTESIRNRPTFFEFVNMPITVPSTIDTLYAAASNAVTTSNITLQSFTESPALLSFALGSTTIQNSGGSLQISSIVGNSFTAEQIISKSMEEHDEFTGNTFLLNDQPTSGFYNITYPGGNSNISSSWLISSTGANGTLYAPYTTISTNLFVGRSIQANNLNTITDVYENFYTSSVLVTDSAMFSSVSTASLKNVRVNNTGGSITGNRAETLRAVYCSSIRTDEIFTHGAALRFTGEHTFSLPVSYISSLTAGAINTSSLFVPNITTGSEGLYSTINASTPWLQTSTYQMNTGLDPFTVTRGLGTYFDEVSFIAAQNQTAYYTLIDPSAQKKINLSTPYVNTILGTGIRGFISSVTQVASNSQLGLATAQPAVDSLGNTYVASESLGWRLQRIDPSGQIRTIAGAYRYFYGDGQYPLNAAVSPRLAVSVPSPGTILITDISNGRIRYVNTDPIIMTTAGTGEFAYSGDGGLAFFATFSTPTTTATDRTGRTYVADTGNQVIRVITGSTINLYGGTPGVRGGAGDGGPATAATLNSPFGLATDSANNVLFTDLSNSVIRSISPAGQIQLVAGSYINGFSGDGSLASAAKLSLPRGIAVDSQNNIFFCDTGNSRIRRIDAVTNIITTVAGNGVSAYGGDGGLALLASLSTPTGIAVDSANNLYVADTNNQCIRYVNLSTNVITTVAGRATQRGYGGDRSFATFAFLDSPSHIAFDPTSRYYYFGDDGNARIRYVNSATNIIFTEAGNGSPVTAGDGGPALGAIFNTITSVATDSQNNIYITDGAANTIRKINAATSTIYAVAGTGQAGFSGDGGLASLANLSSPQTIVLDSNNNMFFTDMGAQRVRRIDAITSTIDTVVGTGVAGYNGDYISSVTAELNYPKALAIDPTGALYIGDNSNYRIRRTDPGGFITTFAGTGLQGVPQPGDTLQSTSFGAINAVALGSQGQLYFTESTTSAVWQASAGTLQPLSALSTPAYLGDASPLSTAYFNDPTGIAQDASGNLLICDAGNFRLRRTYTFGYPLNPMYVNMVFKYTNYFVSTGSATISLNGNHLVTFYASTQQQTTSFLATDLNTLNYPLQGSNPVYGNQQPYIQITQTGANGYTKLEGHAFINEFPQQGLLHNTLDSNAGIVMNSGRLIFPYQNNGITIQNSYNDASLRTVNYTGSLINASDPALKEGVEPANLGICYNTIASIPLHRYNYIEPYMSTFHTRDRSRLGFLTSEVAHLLPKSVESTSRALPWAPTTSINTLDMAQLKYSHLGVTQRLIESVSEMEAKVSTLRAKVAQRNSVL